MTVQYWGFSDDLSVQAIWAVGLLGFLSIVWLFVEARTRSDRRIWVIFSGIIAIGGLLLAVLRPTRVVESPAAIGARIVVLVDDARRADLPSEDRDRTPRWQHARLALEALRRRYADARVEVASFSEALSTAPVAAIGGAGGERSDLVAALLGLSANRESVTAVVILSDGRFSLPRSGAHLQTDLAQVSTAQLHTVKVASAELADVSIRAIRMPGAVVAHQTFSIEVEVGASGAIACERVVLTIRQLRRGEGAAVVGRAEVVIADGRGVVQIPVTLERAGPRVLDLEISKTEGDVVPANDRRIVAVSVKRDRVRVLHVAGRPTYDVRALRTWLKSDQAIDVVTFFILRTKTDNANTVDDAELALIPFPVHELFAEHLPSFDAVIIQDIDAVEYELAEHTASLARYVDAGGGLIMVGGPGAFAAGHYARTPLQSVMPVEMSVSGRPYDTLRFRPQYTSTGRVAPMLLPLRRLLGEQLPEMTGANTLGAPRKGALVLWEHPQSLLPEGSASMPVLALGQSGDGRTIALGVDGTFGLAYGALAAGADGRAYGALWDGLLGWLMREPHYESAQVSLAAPCILGRDLEMRVAHVPGVDGEVKVDVRSLDGGGPTGRLRQIAHAAAASTVFWTGLGVGGYSADVAVGDGPPTRFDFACEQGGEAWSDSRPDAERMRRIASLTHGTSVSWDETEALPEFSGVSLIAQRQVRAWAAPWVWSLLAASALGCHWILRRQQGLV